MKKIIALTTLAASLTAFSATCDGVASKIEDACNLKISYSLEDKLEAYGNECYKVGKFQTVFLKNSGKLLTVNTATCEEAAYDSATEDEAFKLYSTNGARNTTFFAGKVVYVNKYSEVQTFGSKNGKREFQEVLTSSGTSYKAADDVKVTRVNGQPALKIVGTNAVLTSAKLKTRLSPNRKRALEIGLDAIGNGATFKRRTGSNYSSLKSRAYMCKETTYTYTEESACLDRALNNVGNDITTNLKNSCNQMYSYESATKCKRAGVQALTVVENARNLHGSMYIINKSCSTGATWTGDYACRKYAFKQLDFVRTNIAVAGCTAMSTYEDAAKCFSRAEVKLNNDSYYPYLKLTKAMCSDSSSWASDAACYRAALTKLSSRNDRANLLLRECKARYTYEQEVKCYNYNI